MCIKKLSLVEILVYIKIKYNFLLYIYIYKGQGIYSANNNYVAKCL